MAIQRSNSSVENEEEEAEDAVFVNYNDVMQEINIDEEELPDDDGEDEDGNAGDLEEENNDDEEAEEVEDSVHAFTGHEGPVYSLACNPADATLVATGGGDDITFLWRIGEGDFHHTLQGHTDSVAALAFSSDGQLLASGGLDGIVNVWESSTGTLRHKLEGPGDAIEWVKWHPRGKLVLAGSEDFTAWLWNAETGACMTVLSGHGGSVTCGDFTPDGRTICTGGEDGSFRVWNPRTGESTRVVQGHPFHTEGLTCLSISSDSTIAITGSTDTNACLINIQTGRVAGALTEHTKSVETTGFADGLPMVATGGMEGKLIIWDLQTLSARATCEHEDGVVKLLWSPMSQVIYTGCLDGKVRAWDGRTGNCEHVYQGHKDSILDIALTKDGRFILSGSDDNTARAFEVL
ncbi:hypothetical protein CY35_13G001800 [Sphagnum magellanicum]|nr:hypothetical protein CY35_13G001800 [Sphagnum magellanicum]